MELVNGRAAFKRFSKAFSFPRTSLEGPEFVLQLAIQVKGFDHWPFLRALHVSHFHHVKLLFNPAHLLGMVTVLVVN